MMESPPLAHFIIICNDLLERSITIESGESGRLLNVHPGCSRAERQ